MSKIIFIFILVFVSNKQNQTVALGFPNLRHSTFKVESIPTQQLDTIVVTAPNFEPLKYVSFSYIVREGSKRYRKMNKYSYQNSPNDSGNKNNSGILVGTNRSIAAKTYENYTGKVATVKRMKALPKELAFDIYKKKYWCKIRGEEMKVHNPLLVDMIFNAYCSSPASTISSFKKIISSFNHPTDKIRRITSNDIIQFNKICSTYHDEKSFYNEFRKSRDEFYTRKSKNKNKRGLLKWLNDYDISSKIYL